MPEPSYERITCDDVKVGDLIARTRNEVFTTVTAIDEGPVSRRLHLGYDVAHLQARIEEVAAAGSRTWAASLEGDLREALDLASPGTAIAKDAGNIRPRRTAKLWREVIEEPSESEADRVIRELRAATGYDPDRDGTVDELIGYKDALEDELYQRLS